MTANLKSVLGFVRRYYERPQFTLQDFVMRVSEAAKLPLQKVQQVAFSRHTYKEIQRLLSELCLTRQKEVHAVQLKMDGQCFTLAVAIGGGGCQII